MLKKGIPIRTHLIIISLLVFIVPVIIAGSFLYMQTTQQVYRYIEENLVEQAKLISQMADQNFSEFRKEVSGNTDAESYTRRMFEDKLVEYLEGIEVGESGYVFIIDERGNYVLSERRRKDGENILELQDENGRYFVKEMIEEAKGLHEHEVRLINFTWKNPISGELQKKVNAYFYFKPWDWVIGASAVMEDYMGGIRVIRMITLASVGVLILLALGVSFLFGKIYTRPLERLEGVMQRIGEGDLTHSVEFRSSIREIRRMSEDFQEKLIGGMREMLLRIKELVHYSHETGEEISNQVEGTLVFTNQMAEELSHMRKQMFSLDERINEASSASDQIRATIKSVNDQIENQSSSVTETSAAIEEMNSAIQSVARISEERQKASKNLLDITSQGGEKVSQTNEIIQEIGVSIEDMMDMITVINKVAAQTNLLAMNAAIEAAHAGDAGRGFAVVAEEIRNLSTSTSESAKKISNRLKEIVNRIQEATQISDDTGKSFQDVKGEVDSFVDAFSEIVSSTAQLSTGSEEMLNSVGSLQNITQEIKTGSDEMTSGISEIAETLNTLSSFSQETVGHLKTLMEKNQYVNFAQGNMTDMVIKNSENSANLSQELKKFRIDSSEEDFSDTAGEFVHFTMGALVLQEWIVRLRSWMDNDSRGDTAPTLENSALDKWLEDGASQRYSEQEHFKTFLRSYQVMKENTPAVAQAVHASEQEAAEEAYRKIVEALKNAKSSLHSLRYEFFEEK